jgi:hypothetical protein
MLQPIVMAPGAHRIVIATETQADNFGGQGWRECFSSSAAALARYWGRVVSDDEYNKVRRRYGDTTNPQAQLLALRSLGLAARFVTNGNPDLIRAEVRAGRPVAVGWIHQGHIQAPRGTGHWSVAAGFRANACWMMDPNGEADMVNGGYVTTGRGWQGWYSWTNFVRRWEVTEGTHSWRYASGNGWALLVSGPIAEVAARAA